MDNNARKRILKHEFVSVLEFNEMFAQIEEERLVNDLLIFAYHSCELRKAS